MVLYIDYKYLFNKAFHETVINQRVKYHLNIFGNNIIALNRYNLLLDTILSIISIVDNILMKLQDKYKDIKFIETETNIKIPSHYKDGYYLPEFKRFVDKETLEHSLLYTTKLLTSHIKVINNRLDKHRDNEGDINKKTLSKALKSHSELIAKIEQTVYTYDTHFKTCCEDDYNNYDCEEMVKKTNIYKLVNSFNYNLFRSQNSLTMDELKNIYQYIASISHIEIVDEIYYNEEIIILSQYKGNIKGKYIMLTKDNEIKANSNKQQQELIIKKPSIMSLNISVINRLKNIGQKYKQIKLTELINNVNNNCLLNNVLDIDPRNGINLFIDCYNLNMYNVEMNTSIIDNGYKQKDLYNDIQFISSLEYNNFLPKIISLYKFNFFTLQ